MEIFKVLQQNFLQKKDNTADDRLEYNRIRSTIEDYCAEYLKDSSSILKFEALPNVMDATVEFLESRAFQDKYEFQQVTETCFIVRLREIDLF